MDKVDQEYYAEIMNSTDSSEVGNKKRETVSVKDDGTTLEDIEVNFCFYISWCLKVPSIS